MKYPYSDGNKPPVKTFPHLVTFFRILSLSRKTPRSSVFVRFVRVVRWPSLTIDEALVALYEPYYDARGTYEVLYPFAAMGRAPFAHFHHGASVVLVGLYDAALYDAPYACGGASNRSTS